MKKQIQLFSNQTNWFWVQKKQGHLNYCEKFLKQSCQNENCQQIHISSCSVYLIVQDQNQEYEKEQNQEQENYVLALGSQSLIPPIKEDQTWFILDPPSGNVESQKIQTNDIQEIEDILINTAIRELEEETSNTISISYDTFKKLNISVLFGRELTFIIYITNLDIKGVIAQYQQNHYIGTFIETQKEKFDIQFIKLSSIDKDFQQFEVFQMKSDQRNYRFGGRLKKVTQEISNFKSKFNNNKNTTIKPEIKSRINQVQFQKQQINYKAQELELGADFLQKFSEEKNKPLKIHQLLLTCYLMGVQGENVVIELVQQLFDFSEIENIFNNNLGQQQTQEKIKQNEQIKQTDNPVNTKLPQQGFKQIDSNEEEQKDNQKTQLEQIQKQNQLSQNCQGKQSLDQTKKIFEKKEEEKQSLDQQQIQIDQINFKKLIKKFKTMMGQAISNNNLLDLIDLLQLEPYNQYAIGDVRKNLKLQNDITIANLFNDESCIFYNQQNKKIEKLDMVKSYIGMAPKRILYYLFLNIEENQQIQIDEKFCLQKQAVQFYLQIINLYQELCDSLFQNQLFLEKIKNIEDLIQRKVEQAIKNSQTYQLQSSQEQKQQ